MHTLYGGLRSMPYFGLERDQREGRSGSPAHRAYYVCAVIVISYPHVIVSGKDSGTSQDLRRM